jgi:hypothetical protein
MGSIECRGCAVLVWSLPLPASWCSVWSAAEVTSTCEPERSGYESGRVAPESRPGFLLLSSLGPPTQLFV